jgi:PAS domain S-box-containing protein
VAVVAAMGAVAAWGQDQPQPPPRRLIVFGGDESFPPFEFLDREGRAQGFQVDLVRAIGRTMDIEVDVRLGPWQGIKDGFLAGRIDVVGLFDQPERHVWAEFGVPHTTNGSEFFIRYGSREVESFEDLAGKEVIVQASALAEETLRARGVKAVLITVPTEAEAIRLLASGRHDVALVTQFGGRLAMQRFGLTNVTTSGPLVLASDYCLTVRKGEAGLLADLNQGLEILKRTGEFNRLYERWLGALERPAVSFAAVARYAFWVVGPLAAAVIIVVGWTRSLRMLVERRTRQLRSELHERLAAQSALRESEEQWRTLIEHAPEAILVYDRAQNRFIEANENATVMLRLSRNQLKSTGFNELFAAEQAGGDSPAPLAAEWLGRVGQGESLTREALLRDARGREFPAEVRLVELPSETRPLVRVSLLDISERRRSERRQAAMMTELDHRTKNTLACVQGMADQLIAQSGSLPSFRDSFAERIQAMARAHEALADTRWSGMSLWRAVRLVVNPFVGDGSPRIECVGEDVDLPPETATSLCMVLNELATNALKHGALASPGGRVRVIAERPAAEALRLRWEERDVVGPAMNGTPGFGLSLVRGLVEYQLRGAFETETGPAGIGHTITIPLLAPVSLEPAVTD